MRGATIVGAGLAGLIAAYAWPSANVLEAMPSPRAMHRALLRFRSDAVANLTGIEFRKVRVHKGIWSEGRFVQPSIRVANQYAKKVAGRLAGDRSIWDIAPVDRYVAPDTFYEQLVESAGKRIFWDTAADLSNMRSHAIVSTAPLPVALKSLGIQPEMTFERAGILVARCRVPDADVFQTVYFPDEETPMYRASITGSTLIVEAMAGKVDPKEWWPRAMVLIGRAFATEVSPAIDIVGQHYGKIVPIADADRKRLLFGLTQQHNIYSLGRFATWRNILLDDVVKDIHVIKQLIKSQPYDAKRSTA